MQTPFKETLIAFAAMALLAGAAKNSNASPPSKNDEPMAEVVQDKKKHADRAKENPEVPNKKKAGEVCTSSAECRHHHRCEKQGEKSVCVAPQLHEIPKT